jgi:hypothetical protein
MTQENLPAADVMSEDDFETIGDYHRSAAYHFTAAAKHHLAAAAADDDGDDDTSARQAHLAYRHQLHAVQYAEIATMESDTPDDEDEALEAAAPTT